MLCFERIRNSVWRSGKRYLVLVRDEVPGGISNACRLVAEAVTDNLAFVCAVPGEYSAA
jgi:hypothetical protein